MASNPHNPLDLFTSPDSQGVNTVDQTLNLTGTSSAQASPLLWDDLTADGGPASPSTAPTSLSFGSLAQASGSSALTDPNSPAPSRPSSYGQSRQILATRGSRQRVGHERKRSKLSTDSTPFDSVDYWIQFDNEDSTLADVPEDAEATTSKPENATGGSSSAQRTRKSAMPRPPLRSTTSVSDVSSRLQADDYYIDDSALDNALSDEEQAFSMNLADHLAKYDAVPPRDVPPREGLYSTPLSWEKPQPGLRMDSLMGLNSPMLSEAEQRRLIAIAMNPGPSMGGLGSNINLQYGGLDTTLGAGLGTTTMSEVTNMPGQAKSQARQPQPGNLKRQGSGLDKGKDKQKLGDRAAHNDIERKYRTNLKDKISELRDAVPSLRTISEVDGDDGDGSQPSRAPKVSKGTVLTKATEYIHYLERRNKQIVLEHNELSRRLQAFEQLLQASARQNFQMPNYSRTLFDPRGFC